MSTNLGVAHPIQARGDPFAKKRRGAARSRFPFDPTPLTEQVRRHMIHNVYFWLKADLGEEDRALFESELSRLPEIGYLEFGKVGRPAATAVRPVTDNTFDYSLLLSFRTMEDHDRYQGDDPDHTRFVETCKGMWERVVVHDSDVISESK